MNRDYFTSPHQSTRDARVYGKTGPIQSMQQPGFWKRLFGWIGL